MAGFSNVEMLAVVRDADEDAKAVFQSIKQLISKEELEPPNKLNKISQGRP